MKSFKYFHTALVYLRRAEPSPRATLSKSLKIAPAENQRAKNPGPPFVRSPARREKETEGRVRVSGRAEEADDEAALADAGSDWEVAAGEDEGEEEDEEEGHTAADGGEGGAEGEEAEVDEPEGDAEASGAIVLPSSFPWPCDCEKWRLVE